MRTVLIIGLVIIAGIGAAYFGSIASKPEEVPAISVPAAPKGVTFAPASLSQGGPTSAEVQAAQQQNVVVADAEDVESPCAGTKLNNFSCYETYYEKAVKTKGIAAAFADLKALYPNNPYVRAQCHPLTHVLGRVTADQFKTVGEAYTLGDGFCWSGYYHGVLESFIGRIGLENLPMQMDEVCSAIPGKDRYSFDYYNCVHGLGHGVMAVNDNELFQALDMCDNLTGNWEQLSCASGAYMENVIVDGLNHTTKYLKPSEPLYPCNESPEKYKMTCYLMQTSYMLKVNGGDFKKTFEWCAGAESGYQETCYQSLGRDASGRSTSNVAETKATCLLGEGYIQQSHCVVGAVKDFISYFHSDVQAKELCNSLAAPEGGEPRPDGRENQELVNLCLDTAKSYYTLF